MQSACSSQGGKQTPPGPQFGLSGSMQSAADSQGPKQIPAEVQLTIPSGQGVSGQGPWQTPAAGSQLG